MKRLLPMIPGFLVLAGCGVTVHVSTRVRTSTSGTQTKGGRTFSSPEMAIHFSYPAAFAAAPIKAIGRKLERDKRITRAALQVGSSGYDLLIVTRYAKITPPVTAGNIHGQKRFYDQGLTKLFGRRMTASVDNVGGLPALRYPDAPTPGVPVNATTRATFVFVGHDEYELQCQWTAAQRSAVLAACGEILRTLHT